MTPDSAPGTAELTPRQTFSGVVQHSVLFVAVIGVGVLFLGWFSGIWALGAKIGFWLAAALTGLECVHAATAILLTVTLNATGKPRTGEAWMVAANAVQLAGAAAGVAGVLLLRSRLWG